MKKGELLEKTLFIVQESLKELRETEIFCNHKIKNQSGRKREFDIVIKSTLNNFEIIVVIECKDYKKPVNVEKIEAFHSKCLRIPNINKKIFVSQNGYQIDAKNAANEFGIEIYKIEKLENELVKSWLSFSNIKPVARYIKIIKAQLKTNPTIKKHTFDLSSEIYDENKSDSKTFEKFIVDLIKHSGDFSHRMYFTTEDEIIDKSETYSVEVEDITGLYLLGINNSKYYITNIFVVFNFVEREIQSSVKVERIKSSNKVMSTVITHETKSNETIKLVIDEKSPNKFIPFIINNESGKIYDSGFSFEFKKSNDK